MFEEHIVMEHADGCRYIDDEELLSACDEHRSPCNTFESSLLDKMMKQVHRGKIPLSKKQRQWLIDMRIQLDGR